MSKPPVGHRGRNIYKMKDGVRAIKIARSGGMRPGMLEIETKDGTVFRVFDLEAAAGRSNNSELDKWIAERDAHQA